MRTSNGLGVLACSLALVVLANVRAEARIPSGDLARRRVSSGQPRYLMAHYMSWFEARPFDGVWGWHWTMGHFDPQRVSNGRREIASQYSPLIGPYASDDPDVLEYHVLLLKMAGFDGVILDWYGVSDFLDYGMIHRNAELLIPWLRKAQLKFAVCFEDQTLPKLIAAKRITEVDAVPYGQRLMLWLNTHWFSDPSYLLIVNRPLLLVFGPQYYADAQWPLLFAPLAKAPFFLTLHSKRGIAVGAFDWPLPEPNLGLRAVDDFYRRAAQWTAFLPTAFPRFHDIYLEAGVGQSYGSIPDDDGKTYAETLERAVRSDAAVIQATTWNDWGEGTQIEPSVEFGYRDLEQTQRLRQQYLDRRFRYTAADLRLPLELYNLRKKLAGIPEAKAALDGASERLLRGKIRQGRDRLRRIERKWARSPTVKPG